MRDTGFQRLASIILAACILARGTMVLATAYGSINNFDAVNDNGAECHGFEIEIEDAHSTDVTYTYDWNHYGVPNISEDTSDPVHPRVRVRYESKKNPDGTWAAYTAVPTQPISPTDGHQFTDPTINFGGEHFGVGFYGTPTAVRYHWLVDDGSGNLIYGTAVNISTPTFTYQPPNGGGAPQVQAVIVPAPPEIPPLEFGEASWVKETRTQSHNNRKVELRELISDELAAHNWRNGEPDEVEVEWQILQKDYKSVNGGKNGELAGAPEDLQNGDEVITRRYDFYKYIGPVDAETGEALCESVGPDGVHGVGIKTIDGVEVDLSTIEVVGEYVGAQMAGFDAEGKIGLIDHVQDGELNMPYPNRSLVIAGTPPITTVQTGALPDGMTFDPITGVLSGTPTVAGTFAFGIRSLDSNAGDVATSYTLTIAGVPALATITTRANPPEAGQTVGDGDYAIGDTILLSASENRGYVFVNWTDGGGNTLADTFSYYPTVAASGEYVANFAPATMQAPFIVGAFRKFAVLAENRLENDSPSTVVVGDMGITPGTQTAGLGLITLTGESHIADDVAARAWIDVNLAMADLWGRAEGTVILNSELAGRTLPPGLYDIAGTMTVNGGEVTFDALDNPDAIFIVRCQNLAFSPMSTVALTGGARSSNIWWVPAENATIQGPSSFAGNILANTSIDLAAETTVQGRVLSRGGGVFLHGGTVQLVPDQDPTWMIR